MHIEFQYTLCDVSPLLKSKNNIQNIFKKYKDRTYIDSNYPKILGSTSNIKQKKRNLLSKLFKKSSLRKKEILLPDFITHKYEYSDFIKINRKSSGTIYKAIFTRNRGIINILQYGYEFYLNAYFAQQIATDKLVNRLLKHIFNDIRINIRGRFNDESISFAKEDLKKSFLRTLTNTKNYASIDKNMHMSNPIVILRSEGAYFKNALNVSCEHMLTVDGIDLYYKELTMQNKGDKFNPEVFVLHCIEDYNIDTFKEIRCFLLKLNSEKYALNTVIDNCNNYKIKASRLHKFFKNCKNSYHQGINSKSDYIKELMKNEFIINPIRKTKVEESIKEIYKDRPFNKYSTVVD